MSFYQWPVCLVLLKANDYRCSFWGRFCCSSSNATQFL